MTSVASSAERRITVLKTLYPRLREWAERDGLTVADVANAILLQAMQPYQTSCCCQQTSQSTGLSTGQPTMPTLSVMPSQPDPYQVATLENW